MSKAVIQVEGLAKKYIIGHEQAERYTALRDVLANNVKGIWRKTRDLVKGKDLVAGDLTEDFWALNDVSFEIEQGERIGIIGRNGAGKSTLLKLLSRITEPTSGRITIRGRVASLLEVGTGFHPELTGRENVFLNGAILGMGRTEIKKKFDEIVAFAEVEKFLDTPVKRYSSGMYVRLAFAVAAHLEPEVLIVDEVLAVGDAQFQKKCLGKMEDVSKNEGRTVLLVSHSMTTVQSLATKTIFLSKGQTIGVEPVHSGVQKYLYGGVHDNVALFKPALLNSKSEAYITEARLLNREGEPIQNFLSYEPIILEVTWVNNTGVAVVPNFMMVNQQGITAMVASDAPIDFYGTNKKAIGTYISTFTIPANLLNANDYFIHLALDNHSPKVCYDAHMDCFRFTITDPMDEKSIARGAFKTVREDAVMWPALECNFKKID
jgi:lipopolysaccharide transport system ATP-binding protein